MNIVCLSGNLAEDVKVYTNSDGIEIVKGVIAVGRKTAKKQCDFINFTVLGGAVEYVKKYGKKGTRATIQGNWNHSSWKDKEGNYKVSDACLVEEINFSNVVAVKEKVDDNQAQDIADDDLPF